MKWNPIIRLDVELPNSSFLNYKYYTNIYILTLFLDSFQRWFQILYA